MQGPERADIREVAKLHVGSERADKREVQNDMQGLREQIKEKCKITCRV